MFTSPPSRSTDIILILSVYLPMKITLQNLCILFLKEWTLIIHARKQGTVDQSSIFHPRLQETKFIKSTTTQKKNKEDPPERERTNRSVTSHHCRFTKKNPTNTLILPLFPSRTERPNHDTIPIASWSSKTKHTTRLSLNVLASGCVTVNGKFPWKNNKTRKKLWFFPTTKTKRKLEKIFS